jgi:ubiquinone/menaquinone biosynthesis C-methylase UbiE
VKATELAKMAALEDRYWWFVGRRFIVAALLRHFGQPDTNPPLLLDLGCGTGGSLGLLRRFGRVVGLDASPDALAFAARKQPDVPLVLGDAQKLPFASDCFDLVAVLDVLEHLPDDRQALREIWRVLKPKGFVLFTVPAFMSLWSVHDIALGHYRRYLPSELLAKLREAKLTVRHWSFAICPLLPAVFVFRKVQNWWMQGKEAATALIELPDPLNRTLIALLKLEASVLTRFRLPFGVSIVGVAQKTR